MKVLPILALLLAFSVGLFGKTMPWETIAKGNAYWAEILGVHPVTPKQASAQRIISATTVQPDASLRLINAAVRYQIKQLSASDLIRFSDSLMHVMVYVSGGSPMAADAYGRAGWWRLSYPVALRYGLRVDAHVDERLNFELSTRAAMRYVHDLQRQFGHTSQGWLQAFVESPLAVTRPASYFAQDSLQRAMRALKKLMGESDYSAVEQYAVQHFYSTVKEVRSKDVLRVDVLIENTGIPQHAFLALNPELCGGIIPAKKPIKLTVLAAENLRKTEEDVILLSKARLEEETTKLAQAQEKAINNEPDPRKTTTYRVRSGDNLGRIAARFGVGVSDLKSWNNIRGDLIYAGQKLVVYGTNRTPQHITPKATTPEKKNAEPITFEPGEYIAYKVKNGDTLWSIAKQFPGVSPDNIMAWNGISASIKVGQEIKILKREIRDYNPATYPDAQ